MWCHVRMGTFRGAHTLTLPEAGLAPWGGEGAQGTLMLGNGRWQQGFLGVPLRPQKTLCEAT